jgi:Flp pilus assembly CpaF family ATPase
LNLAGKLFSNPAAILSRSYLLNECFFKKPLHHNAFQIGNGVGYGYATIILPPATLGTVTMLISIDPKQSKHQEQLSKIYGSPTVSEAVTNLLRQAASESVSMLISSPSPKLAAQAMEIIGTAIPNHQRVIVCEFDSSSIKLSSEHVVYLTSHVPIGSAGGLTQKYYEPSYLFKNALKHQPDYVIAHPITKEIASDFLDGLMQTPILATIQANGPMDALHRLSYWTHQQLPGLAVEEAFTWLIRSIPIVVHITQDLSGGIRMNIANSGGLQENLKRLTYLYRFEQTHLADGKVQGRYNQESTRPSFLNL